MDEDNKMPPSLQANLVTLAIMALTVLGTKLGLDAKSSGDFAVAAAPVTVATIIGIVSYYRAASKIKTAEDRVPGITKPTGPVSPKTTIYNDPTSTTKPIVISESPPQSEEST